MKWLAGLVLFLAAFGGAAIVRARHDAVIPYPGDEVSAALARLSQPSVPRPLPGDPTIAVGWYGRAGNCDEARAAYQAADAPLPAGATATVDGAGNVQVAAPFGPAGIVLADTADGACNYAIESAPTLVISGPGVRETASFSTVVCSTILGINIVGGDFDTADGPFYVAAALGDTPGIWTVGIGGGHFVDGLQGKTTPGASTEQTKWTAPVTTTSNGYVFDGQGPQGPVHVEMTCTPFKGST
jgi:hypothetical protein